VTVYVTKKKQNKTKQNKTKQKKKNNRNKFFGNFVGLHARINWQTKILPAISGG